MTEDAQTPERPRTPERQRRRRPPAAATRAALLFALPALALYAFVVVIPGVQGISYAFTDWEGRHDELRPFRGSARLRPKAVQRGDDAGNFLC